MNSSSSVVAVFATHDKAESALKMLQQNGIDMKKISLVGRDYHSEEHPIGYFNIGQRMGFYGKFGAFWGGMAGILLGSFVMFIPVFGHLIVLGPLAATIVSGAQGAVLGGGAGAVVGALTNIGVPRNSAVRYEVELKADKFLLVVHSSASEVALARTLLELSDAESVEMNETSSTPASA